MKFRTRNFWQGKKTYLLAGFALAGIAYHEDQIDDLWKRVAILEGEDNGQ